MQVMHLYLTQRWNVFLINVFSFLSESLSICTHYIIMLCEEAYIISGNNVSLENNDDDDLVF